MDHIYPAKPECFNGGHAAKNACNWQMKSKISADIKYLIVNIPKQPEDTISERLGCFNSRRINDRMSATF
ncbi:hypothetical protein [Shewanella oncorhynchi]|uniref:hypothetical protein n=1 Tax=Shewanella oncorhynchi TaxID=2726434 RepID=UPI003D7BC7FC